MKQKENEKKNDKRKKSSVGEFLDMIRGIGARPMYSPRISAWLQPRLRWRS